MDAMKRSAMIDTPRNKYMRPRKYMTALPACSPSGGLSGSHTGSRIPGLHTTVSVQARFPESVELPVAGCGSGPDARSTSCGLKEVQGLASSSRRSGQSWRGRDPIISQ